MLDVATGLFTMSGNSVDSKEDVESEEKEVVKSEKKDIVKSEKSRIDVVDSIQSPSGSEIDVKPTTSADNRKRSIAVSDAAMNLAANATGSANRSSVDAKHEIVIDSDDEVKPTAVQLEQVPTPLVGEEVTVVCSEDEEIRIPRSVIRKPTAPRVKKSEMKVPTLGSSTSRLLNNLPSISIVKKLNSEVTLLKRVTKVVTKQESTCVRSEMVEGDGSTVVETKCKTIRVRSFGNVPFAAGGSKNATKVAKAAVVDDNDDDDVIILD